MRKTIPELRSNRRSFYEKIGREFGIYGKDLLQAGESTGNILFDTIQVLEDTVFSAIVDYDIMDQPTPRGEVTVDGTTITRVSGPYFNKYWVDATITIDGEEYSVESVDSESEITLEAYTTEDEPATTLDTNVKQYRAAITNMYQGITFPAGIVLFGFFTNLAVTSGACVAYRSREQ